MTDLINQITINGQINTFLNYVNPLGTEEVRYSTANLATITSFLQSAWGVNNLFYAVSGNTFYCILPTEPYPAIYSTPASATKYRLRFRLGALGNTTQLNSSTTPTIQSVFDGTVSSSLIGNNHSYYVANNNSLCIAGFTNSARTTPSCFFYIGWLRNNQFTGAQINRGLAVFQSATPASSMTGFRALQENTTGSRLLTIGSPALSCSISTPGADSSETILQDSVSPFWHVGDMWNTIRMPSSCQYGKIYKNMGIDPDTGSVETDQKAFWMCVGAWGTNKLGIRVWTEGFI